MHIPIPVSFVEKTLPFWFAGVSKRDSKRYALVRNGVAAVLLATFKLFFIVAEHEMTQPWQWRGWRRRADSCGGVALFKCGAHFDLSPEAFIHPSARHVVFVCLLACERIERKVRVQISVLPSAGENARRKQFHLYPHTNASASFPINQSPHDNPRNI